MTVSVNITVSCVSGEGGEVTAWAGINLCVCKIYYCLFIWHSYKHTMLCRWAASSFQCAQSVLARISGQVRSTVYLCSQSVVKTKGLYFYSTTIYFEYSAVGQDKNKWGLTNVYGENRERRAIFVSHNSTQETCPFLCADDCCIPLCCFNC